MHPTIPPGAVLLTYAQARARLGHEGKSTFHDRLKRDPILTPAEKRQKLDALTVERNALLKAAVQDSKDAQKASTAADMAKRGINQEQ
jgi:hypothetical protein